MISGLVKLLVIADDFTGALDTGIQFRGEGTVLRFDRRKSFFEGLPEKTDVLIVDAETRHLAPEEAAGIVGDIVAEAARKGVYCIYKKTDSGLRGNIGSELAAALEQSNSPVLHFVPALPQLHRVTKAGIHYIDGQKVADSVFGKDPFEPVLYSDVRQIIGAQSSARVTLAGQEETPGRGIILHDAQTEEDLHRIARELRERDELRLLAGCAGFAAALPELLGLQKEALPEPNLPEKLLVVCGSVNAITLNQMDAAEQEGFPRIRLTVPQKLDAGWLNSPQGQRDLARMLIAVQAAPCSMIECDGLGHPEELERYRRELGLDLEAVRCRISHTMGAILKWLLDNGLEATLMVTGGDTLMAFMELANLRELVPICEYAPGVVLARVTYSGRERYLLSKSGGFGDPKLLLYLTNRITADSGAREPEHAMQ